MARRRNSGEADIGSDSFLDVIANMVGILIILIVIAGVRVSRAPVVLAQPQASKSHPAPVSQPVPPPASAPEPLQEPEPILEPEPVSEPEFEPLVEVTEPPQELQQQRKSLEQELAALAQQEQQLTSELTRLQQRQASGELELRRTEDTILQRRTLVQKRRRTLEELQRLIKAQQVTLTQLESDLAQQKTLTPPVKTLEHQTTAVSQTVAGPQLHFRLSDNRISQVPLDDLVRMAVEQLKGQGPKLMQTRVRIGTAGPLMGYELKYRVEVQGPSANAMARNGGGYARIALTSFEIEPAETLKEETAEEALSAGSRFFEAIQIAPPGTTFTLWVYPDSYPLFRQMQKVLHDQGFLVAGRPLPKGIPISGSPEGSASAGQ